MDVVEFKGMTCPVHPDSMVQIWLNDGVADGYVERAGEIAWNVADPEEGRPLRYRVLSVPMSVPEQLLEAAAGHVRARATAYDQPQGERSMARTVAAFNAVTGQHVTESQGWLFMELLKAVRDFTAPGGHEDSQEDRIAYAALGAEARRAGR